MKVCVIGAGVVGCASAYQLARVGHEVLLLDSAPQPASGASFANGAQLSYSYVEPLANPATFKSIPKMLLDPQSPLGLRLRPSVSQWKWIASFLRSCAPERSRRGSLALLASASLSRMTNERWMAEDGLDFAVQRNGKLVLCPNAESLASQARQIQLQSGRGAEQTLLTRDACVSLEPALASYPGFVGGVWTPSECAADPRAYCNALLHTASTRGIRMQWSTTASSFVIENQRVVCLHTSAGEITADAFVLATGIDAPQLARQLGESLLIEPIKGFSLTLGMHPGQRAPVTSVTDLARKTVLAPLGGKLRVAAFAELGRMDLKIPARRLAQIQRTVETIYPGLCDFNAPGAWAGLRPATPDSLPVVRQSRVANAFLNVGHGALGFTLAAGCAVQITEAIHEARGRPQSNTPLSASPAAAPRCA
ncbi:FAD-dependent oxidoreductase [uncultured Ramlibacter sp.]|uniref:FAD-dependent oxidoreductase n=1 Tax=uncultured Ramlibacter sp. TaxID=260755 RepID=UPI0026300C47|nr:FAD-dependent oxidoreductase [uncultured Ramlibacter sp.]